MLQLFIIFYGPGLLGLFRWPTMHTGWVWFDKTFDTRFIAAMVAFSINYAAYFSEIFRGGIQSIDKGQMEAGRSLGLNWSRTMRFIIIPQAFKRIIPPLGNEFIALLKDSSLVSVICFEELTRQGQLVIASTYGAMEIWTAVALLYLCMTLPITRLVAILEKKFKKNDRN
jgi:polar amino acid transport system permease protein